MEYRERALVEGGFDRRIEFPVIKWLSKARFEQALRDGAHIEPQLMSHGPSDPRMFVGKSIPRRPPDSDENNNSIGDLQLASYHYLEIIGNVMQREDQIEDAEGRRRRQFTWVLRITHNGHSHDIEDEFVVLQIQDPDTFFWAPSHDTNIFNGQLVTFPNNSVPTFAFQAAFNRLDQKFNYIGRVANTGCSSHQQFPQRLKFYANAWVWFDDGGGGLTNSFGRIGRSCRFLHVPYRNVEVGLDHFETLCLKPSPVSLKTLCRSLVRSDIGNNQTNFQSLAPSIPRTLLEFVKHPMSLKPGEYIMKGEKLASNDGKWEIRIDEKSGELVFKNIDTEKHLFSKSFDTLSVHRFHIVFYDQAESKVAFGYPLYDTLRPFQLTGDLTKFNWKINFL